MNRVVHFEVHAQDLERAKKFYSEVFGWEMQQMGAEMGSYVVIKTGDPVPKDMASIGINGGITTLDATEAHLAQVRGYSLRVSILGYSCG